MDKVKEIFDKIKSIKKEKLIGGIVVIAVIVIVLIVAIANTTNTTSKSSEDNSLETKVQQYVNSHIVAKLIVSGLIKETSKCEPPEITKIDIIDETSAGRTYKRASVYGRETLKDNYGDDYTMKFYIELTFDNNGENMKVVDEDYK